MTDERRYIVHHRGSRFRGRVVRLLVRPGNPRLRKPNNVLAQCVDTDEVFICPWRGVRRERLLTLRAKTA